MAEHHIEEPVIGVAFDGTGYGTDGNIWGGEFLICEGADFTRAAHLAYTPILGGDQSMRDLKRQPVVIYCRQVLKNIFRMNEKVLLMLRLKIK
jgi:hydrogenase maturation protein HypF